MNARSVYVVSVTNLLPPRIFLCTRQCSCLLSLLSSHILLSTSSWATIPGTRTGCRRKPPSSLAHALSETRSTSTNRCLACSPACKLRELYSKFVCLGIWLCAWGVSCRKLWQNDSQPVNAYYTQVYLLSLVSVGGHKCLVNVLRQTYRLWHEGWVKLHNSAPSPVVLKITVVE